MPTAVLAAKPATKLTTKPTTKDAAEHFTIYVMDAKMTDDAHNVKAAASDSMTSVNTAVITMVSHTFVIVIIRTAAAL